MNHVILYCTIRINEDKIMARSQSPFETDVIDKMDVDATDIPESKEEELATSSAPSTFSDCFPDYDETAQDEAVQGVHFLSVITPTIIDYVGGDVKLPSP